MRIIKIAFYKHSESFFWWIIRWKQSFNYQNKYSKYSHVEIVFDDWLSFSSSERDWWVRFKKIKFKKYHWDFVDVHVTNTEYNKIITFCHKHKWDSYNWLWILLSQALNFNLRSKKHWFCSEIVARALQEINSIWPFTTAFVHPARLACILNNKNFKINEK